MKIGECFWSSTSSHDDIKESGARSLVALDILRRKKFGNKVMKNLKIVDIQRLPPTEDGAKYLSYRDYLDSGMDGGTELPPEDWGWKVQCGCLVPRTIESKPVPNVSKIIQYK